MKLDRTFAYEIKKANGDGSLEARLAFLRPAQEAAKKLSTTEAPMIFNSVLREYGRAAVGVCIAATIIDRRDCLEPRTVLWARKVMELWTNRAPRHLNFVTISDGIHPTKIEQYAGSFIRLTTEE